jgi:hypothetical protein
LAFVNETIHVHPFQPGNSTPISIIQICRQIRHESSPLFYTLCTFDISALRYHNRVYINMEYFGIPIHPHNVPTRDLADLDRTSQIVGAANSALITSLQISSYDATEQVRWVRRDVTCRIRLATGGRLYKSKMPHAHGFPALKHVHVCGARENAHRISSSEIKEALCLGFSKQDLVVTFEAAD